MGVWSQKETSLPGLCRRHLISSQGQGLEATLAAANLVVELHCGQCWQQVLTKKINVWNKKDDISASATSNFDILLKMVHYEPCNVLGALCENGGVFFCYFLFRLSIFLLLHIKTIINQKCIYKKKQCVILFDWAVNSYTYCSSVVFLTR